MPQTQINSSILFFFFFYYHLNYLTIGAGTAVPVFGMHFLCLERMPSDITSGSRDVMIAILSCVFGSCEGSCTPGRCLLLAPSSSLSVCRLVLDALFFLVYSLCWPAV